MSDILGDWLQAGAALNQDGSTLYDWAARVLIEAIEGRILVTVSTGVSNSRSVSRVATVQSDDDGRRTLLYDYAADPTHEGSAAHHFFGMTRMVFDSDGRQGSGSYLNYNGRYTFGRLSLTRP